MKKKEFTLFYNENIDRIYRYVFFRVGRDTEIAQDLVSEIFLKAFQHFEKYDPAISKSAWIYRIAHNHLANFYRDRKVHADLDELAPFIEGEHGERTMERKEAEMQLIERLSALANEERLLVTQKYLEGYSYAEMAEIHGRSADALKVATHRAMKKLQAATKE